MWTLPHGWCAARIGGAGASERGVGAAQSVWPRAGLEEKVVSVRVVRLGTPRSPGEGTRIGTVRRPPRGVPKSEFARQNWYDVWFPNLAPSVETMTLGLAAELPAQWNAFVKRYKAEMKVPAAAHDLGLLAALSHTANFSVGCYCPDENHCHRSVLKQLLIERGAKVG
jgi:uncharacterized protein YeaO (DUF488 family)